MKTNFIKKVAFAGLLIGAALVSNESVARAQKSELVKTKSGKSITLNYNILDKGKPGLVTAKLAAESVKALGAIPAYTSSSGRASIRLVYFEAGCRVRIYGRSCGIAHWEW